MVLGLFQGASWTRYVRSAMLDVIRLDYVTTARSKGLSERVILLTLPDAADPQPGVLNGEQRYILRSQYFANAEPGP